MIGSLYLYRKYLTAALTLFLQGSDPPKIVVIMLYLVRRCPVVTIQPRKNNNKKKTIVFWVMDYLLHANAYRTDVSVKFSLIYRHPNGKGSNELHSLASSVQNFTAPTSNCHVQNSKSFSYLSQSPILSRLLPCKAWSSEFKQNIKRHGIFVRNKENSPEILCKF